MIELPAEGRTDPAPDLPAGRDWSAPERTAWAELWSSPQATMWGPPFVPTVAMYVVHTAAVLAGEGSAWMAQEARHLGDRLGLTPQGLASLGWVVSVPRPLRVAGQAREPSPLRLREPQQRRLRAPGPVLGPDD